MNSLVHGVFATTRTKRRRILWCAWWTGEPVAKPFRPPDAWGGGAQTDDEARAMAETAAGMPLTAIEGRWAGAWVRVRAGLPPFVDRKGGSNVAARADRPRPIDPYALLGIASSATLDEVKAAFRRMALVHHPDHGGAPEAFIAIKKAYDSIARKRARRPAR